MVAPGTTAASPFVPTPGVRRMGYGPVRFTVADALSMVAQGILPEDATIELLDGSLEYRDRFDLRGSEIVEGADHNYVVTALGELRSRINDARRHLRTQSTLVCSDAHAPVPDAVVLRGALADYRGRLPTAADAYCVIEVADSSYERDAGIKLAEYAKAGVPQYVIVNLRNRTAEVSANPDASVGTYPPPTVVGSEGSLALRIGEAEWFEVRLIDVLP